MENPFSYLKDIRSEHLAKYILSVLWAGLGGFDVMLGIYHVIENHLWLGVLFIAFGLIFLFVSFIRVTTTAEIQANEARIEEIDYMHGQYMSIINTVVDSKYGVKDE